MQGHQPRLCEFYLHERNHSFYQPRRHVFHTHQERARRSLIQGVAMPFSRTNERTSGINLGWWSILTNGIRSWFN
jgi:hypothetical protein